MASNMAFKGVFRLWVILDNIFYLDMVNEDFLNSNNFESKFFNITKMHGVFDQIYYVIKTS